MTASIQNGRQRLELSFPAARNTFDFLLTCLEDDRLAPGSEIYDNSLNRVYVRRAAPLTVHFVVEAEVGMLRTVVEIASACGGSASHVRPMPAQEFKESTIEKILRCVLLRPADGHSPAADHMLLALWHARGEDVAALLRSILELGVRNVEVAFTRADGANAPTHLVRLQGLKHPDALSSWLNQPNANLGVYSPVGGWGSQARFYAPWGYRFPLPGLDRICRLDTELVLLHLTDLRKPPRWISFPPGQLNIFRKLHEIVDLEIGHTESMLEIEESDIRARVPIELAIVRRPRGGPTRLWQIDRTIDRQRAALGDLEVLRGRIAAGETEESYYAYRFEQDDANGLNASLIRLMQQRVSTLAGYDYSYCRPERGTPFHLVIANRSERQTGFSVQPADRVYYQPATWRRWGVNLFLPHGWELAPRIDTSEAAPLLLAWLDRAGRSVRPGQSADNERELSAVLWDAGEDGSIVETRVVETVPLLSSYRLLNSFQQDLAANIEMATQTRMLAGLQAARETVQVDLDTVERDLLEHVGKRASAIEASYGEMESQIASAERLVTQVTPKVGVVTEMVLRLPGEWVEFVNGVVELHRKLSDPTIDGYERLRQAVRRGRDDLRSLALAGRDLAAATARERGRLADQMAACDQASEEARVQAKELDGQAVRAARLVAEIGKMHSRLAKRLKQIEAAVEKANKLQAEIDDVDSRQKEVEERLTRLQALHAEAEKTAAKVQAQEGEAATQQRAVLNRAADLASRRENLTQSLLRSAQQLERMERLLGEVGTASAEVEQLCKALESRWEMLRAHARAAEEWARRKADWDERMRARQEEVAAQVKDLGASDGQA
jgi:hypothetical protein